MSSVVKTATGIKIGTKGKVLRTRESVAEAIQDLSKGERRSIRKHLFRKGDRSLALAGIV